MRFSVTLLAALVLFSGCEATQTSDAPTTEERICMHDGREYEMGQSYFDGCNWHSCQESGSFMGTEKGCEGELPEKIDCAISYEQNFQKTDETTIEVRFQYPCDWQKDIKGKDTLSAGGTVVAPDGMAAFYLPAPDFGLHGYELVEESTVRVNGEDYIQKEWQSDESTQVIVTVDMGTDLSENGYNLMFVYGDLKYLKDFELILSTLDF